MLCRLLTVLVVVAGAFGHHSLLYPHPLESYNIVKWSVIVCLGICMCLCVRMCLCGCVGVCVCTCCVGVSVSSCKHVMHH